MALTNAEKQEIIDIMSYALADLVRKYTKINTKLTNFKTQWNMTPKAPQLDVTKLTNAKLLIRFRTLRKLKAELDNVTAEIEKHLLKVDAEIVRRRDAV